MRARSVDPAGLTPADRDSWERQRSRAVGLDDPFFSPEYVRLVSEIRGDVEVAVLLEGDRSVGFLPFERRGDRGLPVGSAIAEIAGPVAKDDLEWAPASTLRSIGLSSWAFDCAPASHAALRPYHIRRRPFPWIDLGSGYEAYAEERKTVSSQIPAAERKARKFEREVGPLRFEWRTGDRRALEALFEWKSRQYEETGVKDKFASRWVVQLAERAASRRSGSFEGVVAALYHDDRPLAVHLGIRDGDVLAWWLPAYDPRWSRYSPGLQLLVRLLEEAPGRGVARVHLGQGDERYKRSFSNGGFEVAEGLVDRRAWRRGLRAAWVGARELAQSTPALERPLRGFRSLRERLGSDA